MNQEHIKVFTGSPIFVRRLQKILEENNISSLSKSDKIVGYEISNHIDELYILNVDLAKAKKIIDDFEQEINL